MALLAGEETKLYQKIGFDELACQRVREIVSSPMAQLWGIGETGEDVPVAGLSVVGDEPVRDQIQAALKPMGYLAFGYEKREQNGSRVPGWHIGIIKSADPCDILRVKQTDGCNYEIYNEDITAKRDEWKQICEFEVVAADHDMAELVFARLPENICAFAEDVFRLCNDTVHQDIGLIDIEVEADLLQAAEALCPELSEEIKNYDPVGDMQEVLEKMPEEELNQFHMLIDIAKQLPHPSQEQEIKLLAYSIYTRKRLHLWWD